MKKFLSITLTVFAMTLIFSGCSGNDNTEKKQPQANIMVGKITRSYLLIDEKDIEIISHKYDDSEKQIVVTVKNNLPRRHNIVVQAIFYDGDNVKLGTVRQDIMLNNSETGRVRLNAISYLKELRKYDLFVTITT